MKKQAKSETLTFRPNEDDWKILNWLHNHFGLATSSLIRMALHRLYNSERKQ